MRVQVGEFFLTILENPSCPLGNFDSWQILALSKVLTDSGYWINEQEKSHETPQQKQIEPGVTAKA